jgi:hypothetical protein
MPTADSLARSPINHGFLFRPSNAHDAADAARLIYAAWGSFAHYMFCQADEAHTEALMTALYAQRSLASATCSGPSRKAARKWRGSC